jgi:hypothetical protein
MTKRKQIQTINQILQAYTQRYYVENNDPFSSTFIGPLKILHKLTKPYLHI